MFDHLDPKLAKACRRLLTQPPAKAIHLVSILLDCKVSECEVIPGTNVTFPVACTDGTNIWFNPTCYPDYTTLELHTILAHELIHIANLHPFRQEHRDPMTWNQAIDYRTNADLKRAGFHIPKTALIDDKWETQTPEKIYRTIWEERDDDPPEDDDGDPGDTGLQDDDIEHDTQTPGGTHGRGSGADKDEDLEDDDEDDADQDADEDDDEDDAEQDDDDTSGGSGGDGDDSDDSRSSGGPGKGTKNKIVTLTRDDDWGAVIPPVNTPPEEVKKREEQIQYTITKAQVMQRAMGNHEGGGEGSYATRPLSLREQIAGFIKQSGLEKTDYTWQRPNRRYIGHGLILPSLAGTPQNDELYIAIDTSISVSEPMLKRFLSVLSDLLQEYKSVKITIIQCDTEIKEIRTLTHADLPLKVDIKGRGGTDFNPVFDLIAQDSLPVTALMYFTDLEINDYCLPQETPKFPVAWVNFSPPNYYTPKYGRIIPMED